MTSYSTRCDPIIASRQIDNLIYKNGNTADIIKTILFADQRSAEFVNKDAVGCLVGRNEMDTLKNIWSYVKKNHRYTPDKPGWERVQSPGSLKASKKGDCKSFSVMAAALLRALGFRYKFRFADYKNYDYEHVYVVAYSASGREIILDAVHDYFNDEVYYQRIMDKLPKAQVGGIAGFRAIRGNQGVSAVTLVAVLIGGFIVLKYLEKGQPDYYND